MPEGSSSLSSAPIVLVPGFLGNESHWHLRRLNHKFPQLKFLTMNPGPASSHHDRACEIFYSLKGGATDYGEAHSAHCGHARFGRVHKAGLHPDWDANHPIDIVGHSIGGVTARVLQQLLAEQAFPGHQTSAAWVRSLTCLASPLNGDPVVYGLGLEAHDGQQPLALPTNGRCLPCQQPGTERPATSEPPSPVVRRRRAGASATLADARALGAMATEGDAADGACSPGLQDRLPVRLFSAGWLLTTVVHVIAWLDVSWLLPVDLQLEHWDLSRRSQHPLTTASTLLRALTWRGSFGQSYDNAAYEVSPAATQRLNKRLKTHEATVYLSFSAAAPPWRRAFLRPEAAEEAGPAAPETSKIAAEEGGVGAAGYGDVLRRLMRRGREVGSGATAFAFSLVVRLGGRAHRDAACARAGFDVDDWAAHDGLLSVRGQRAPMGEPCQLLPEVYSSPALVSHGRRGTVGAAASLASQGKAEADPMPPTTPSTADALVGLPQLQPGVWHVQDLQVDHFAVCGGPLASPAAVDAFWGQYNFMRERGFPGAAQSARRLQGRPQLQ